MWLCRALRRRFGCLATLHDSAWQDPVFLSRTYPSLLQVGAKVHAQLKVLGVHAPRKGLCACTQCSSASHNRRLPVELQAKSQMKPHLLNLCAQVCVGDLGQRAELLLADRYAAEAARLLGEGRLRALDEVAGAVGAAALVPPRFLEDAGWQVCFREGAGSAKR